MLAIRMPSRLRWSSPNVSINFSRDVHANWNVQGSIVCVDLMKSNLYSVGVLKFLFGLLIYTEFVVVHVTTVWCFY